jgi:hypothetical protein
VLACVHVSGAQAEERYRREREVQKAKEEAERRAKSESYAKWVALWELGVLGASAASPGSRAVSVRCRRELERRQKQEEAREETERILADQVREFAGARACGFL